LTLFSAPQFEEAAQKEVFGKEKIGAGDLVEVPL